MGGLRADLVMKGLKQDPYYRCAAGSRWWTTVSQTLIIIPSARRRYDCQGRLQQLLVVLVTSPDHAAHERPGRETTRLWTLHALSRHRLGVRLMMIQWFSSYMGTHLGNGKSGVFFLEEWLLGEGGGGLNTIILSDLIFEIMA